MSSLVSQWLNVQEYWVPITDGCLSTFVKMGKMQPGAVLMQDLFDSNSLTHALQHTATDTCCIHAGCIWFEQPDSHTATYCNWYVLYSCRMYLIRTTWPTYCNILQMIRAVFMQDVFHSNNLTHILQHTATDTCCIHAGCIWFEQPDSHTATYCNW